MGAGSIKDSDKSGCTSSEQGSRYMKKAIKPPPRWFRFSRVLTSIPAFLSLLLPIAAAAQDPFSNPSFGEVSLVSGFEPDPHTVSIYAGGSVELSASRLVDCVGFVSDAPDYRVIYDSDNQQRSLSFYAESDSDTVLLVNDPNGEWYCNDDYSDELGLASGLVFRHPNPVSMTSGWVPTKMNSLRRRYMSPNWATSSNRQLKDRIMELAVEALKARAPRS